MVVCACKFRVAYCVIFRLTCLELDALRLFSTVRSVEDAFALANGTPSDVLTLILGYCGGDGGKDQGLIELTIQ